MYPPRLCPIRVIFSIPIFSLHSSSESVKNLSACERSKWSNSIFISSSVHGRARIQDLDKPQKMEDLQTDLFDTFFRRRPSTRDELFRVGSRTPSHTQPVDRVGSSSDRGCKSGSRSRSRCELMSPPRTGNQMNESGTHRSSLPSPAGFYKRRPNPLHTRASRRPPPSRLLSPESRTSTC